MITQYEILKGLQWKGATQQLQSFANLCAGSRIEPLTGAIVEQAAIIWSQLQRTGERIGDADVLVAATALHHGVPLVTGNTEHFKRVAGLTLINWRIISAS